MRTEHLARPARVLIAAPHEIVRAGLSSILEREPEFEIIGDASRGAEMLALSELLRPDLVILDIRLDGANGVGVAPLIKSLSPATKVILLTGRARDIENHPELAAGLSAWVLRSTAARELVRVVRRVVAEEPLPGRQSQVGAPRSPSGGHAPDPVPLWVSLSSREAEVLRELARGKNNAEIAADLVISLSTVKTHVERILSKLRASNRTQAAVRAALLGLLEPADPPQTGHRGGIGTTDGAEANREPCP